MVLESMEVIHNLLDGYDGLLKVLCTRGVHLDLELRIIMSIQSHDINTILSSLLRLRLTNTPCCLQG